MLCRAAFRRERSLVLKRSYRVSVLCRADCGVTGGQYYVELLVRGNDLDLEAPKAIRKSVLCKAA